MDVHRTTKQRSIGHHGVMPVRVNCGTDVVDVVVEGGDRFWGLRKRLELPASRIIDARVMPTRDLKRDLMLRTGGTYFPGLATVGYYRGRDAKRQWWRVYRAEEVLVIDLCPASSFNRVVLQVNDPHEVCRQIRDMVGGESKT
jgi:hypothetical protein